MEDTHITQVVDITADKARYDTEVKNVLSNKYILAWIMSRVTSEFRDLPIETIVSCIEGEPLVSKISVAPGMTNESTIGRDTEDKVPKEGEARFDILFHARSILFGFVWMRPSIYKILLRNIRSSRTNYMVIILNPPDMIY